jgi:hypothetical protein
MHNFAASEQERSSVMDYPQPLIEVDVDNHLSLKRAYDDKIGIWDKQVIAYGYSDFGNQTDEKKQLSYILAEMKQSGLQYLADPDARSISSPHPDANLWDNGSNATVELKRLLKIRKVALRNFGKNTIPVGEPYSSLEELLVPLYFYHRYQIIAVGKSIGGYYYQYAVREDADDFKMLAASGNDQWQALYALVESLQPDTLKLPPHILPLIPPKALGYSKSRESTKGRNGIVLDPVSLAEAAANHTLAVLFNPTRLSRLQQQNIVDKSIPSVAELFEVLKEKLLKVDYLKMDAEVHRRVIHTVILNWEKLYQHQQLSPEVKNELYSALNNYQKWMKQKLWFTLKSSAYYNFYAAESQQIEAFLANPSSFKLPESLTMPPGSPI